MRIVKMSKNNRSGCGCIFKPQGSWLQSEMKIFQDGDKFQPFHKTYNIVSLAMSMGLLYPNPEKDRWRGYMILLVHLAAAPMSYCVLYDIYLSWTRGDLNNIIRHCTVIVPFFLVLSKILVMYINRTAAKEIIDEINRDHRLYNDLSDVYKTIIFRKIQNARLNEKNWAITVTYTAYVFPVMASVQTIYSYLFKSEPKKFMVHDLNRPHADPEMRFESPYYEFMFFYMVYSCVILFMNFLGYDGFFGIAINHACLKMAVYCKRLEEAMQEEDTRVAFAKIVDVIKDQNRLFRFTEIIQKTFNFWLGTIFIGTVIHVCNCMYQITEGLGFDVTYTVFIIGSIIHIFLPCQYAGKLKSTSMETATSIYCSGWEHVPDRRIRQIILFMIARAQTPTIITAFNMLTFDMELFMSILHTSYSMFTLLRS